MMASGNVHDELTTENLNVKIKPAVPNSRTDSKETTKWYQWIVEILPLTLVSAFIVLGFLAKFLLDGKPTNNKTVSTVDQVVKYVSSTRK